MTVSALQGPLANWPTGNCQEPSANWVEMACAVQRAVNAGNVWLTISVLNV